MLVKVLVSILWASAVILIPLCPLQLCQTIEDASYEMMFLDKDNLWHIFGPIQQNSQLQLCAISVSVLRGGSQSSRGGARGNIDKGRGAHGSGHRVTQSENGCA